MSKRAIGWLGALGSVSFSRASRCSPSPAAPPPHVAAAKAVAGGAESDVLVQPLCVPPPAPRRRPRHSPPHLRRRQGPPPRAQLVRGAGQGVRQPVLRRPDRVHRLGGHDLGRHHRHRPAVRLLGRGRGRQRPDEAGRWIRSGSGTCSSATRTATTSAARGSCRSGSARASIMTRGRLGSARPRPAARGRSRSATSWRPTARS